METSLFLHKVIKYVPSLKEKIYDHFTEYKEVHQQLVLFQETKFPSDLLEKLKELFGLNQNNLY